MCSLTFSKLLIHSFFFSFPPVHPLFIFPLVHLLFFLILLTSHIHLSFLFTYTSTIVQLFYLTNLVDSFVLRAKESREVVLAFLPSDRSPVRHKPHSKIHHSFVPVKGVILIQASVIGFNQSKKFRPKQQAPRLQQKVCLLATNVELWCTLINATYSQSCVEFLTNVCKSFMETNVQELDFGDCICGQKYIKDFTVWNRSEIPLVFHLTTKNCALGAFEFSKYETGEMSTFCFVML